jgi:carbamoyltransferase|tara:strand:- start:1171 stop:2637 length:1467 start_codon:yes stop_codon:yes gene_type:complete
MMTKWGISANSHNAALSIFVGDQLVFATSSERYSKIKNDPHLCKSLIDDAMWWGTPQEVYWYESPRIKSYRQFLAGQHIPKGENNIGNYIRKNIGHLPVYYTSHHKSHAAAGYYTSKFDNAAIVVLDAIGEFETCTIWKGRGEKLKKVYSQSYPSSLGLWYSAMTQRCGLKPNEEEYILMGMSAFGDPDRLYREVLSDFFDLNKNPYYLKHNLHKGCSIWREDLHSQKDIFDIAAATQKVYEKMLERTLMKAKSIVKSDNLVLMGGCALNCSANPIGYKFFKDVWIMPAPGDDGSSIGAVLAHTKKHIPWKNPYLGKNLGYNSDNATIVEDLLRNQICGLARGRAEFGPRALGNRSLIADPRGTDIKDRVNEIKKREPFRPFAPAILEEFASEYFDMPCEKSPYMQMVVKCRRPDLYPAIVHVDGTSRVQTVSKEDNPEFRELLEMWYKETGCPMLLNTSLNIKGEPILNDKDQIIQWEEKHKIKIWT